MVFRRGHRPWCLWRGWGFRSGCCYRPGMFRLGPERGCRALADPGRFPGGQRCKGGVLEPLLQLQEGLPTLQLLLADACVCHDTTFLRSAGGKPAFLSEGRMEPRARLLIRGESDATPELMILRTSACHLHQLGDAPGRVVAVWVSP
jgi:hypothetical protein